MSVILNALRSDKKPNPSKSSVQWAQSESTHHFRFPARKFVLGLIVFGVVSSGLFGYFFWFQTPPPVAQLVAQIPKPVPVKINYEENAQRAFVQGDYTASIENYKMALEKAADSWVLLNNLGLSLAKSSQFEEAEAYFHKAIAANVQCASCYNNLGDLEMKRNLWAEAQLYYQKAARVQPDYADPYFNLGVLYEKKGELGAAEDAYASFLEYSADQDSPIYRKVLKRLREIGVE